MRYKILSKKYYKYKSIIIEEILWGIRMYYYWVSIKNKSIIIGEVLLGIKAVDEGKM